MTEKKEIIDFLRNKQKAAEIEAKVNGINLWVLLGAIAIVIWQLIGSDQSSIWNRQELIIHVLLCAELTFITASLCLSPSERIREEARYASFNLPSIESALLLLVTGVILSLPPALSLFFLGNSFSVILPGLLGIILIIFGIVSIAKQALPDRNEPEKLPKQLFNLSRRSNAITNIFFALILLFSFSEEMLTISSQIIPISSEILKPLALIATLYLLVLISIKRFAQSHSLAWTYELETDLLLDVISPQVALRRIEFRALGPKLRDIMDKFFNDLDKKLIELDTLIANCQHQLNEVTNIPPEYKAERADRIANATKQPKAHVNELLNECQCLSKYLEKLSKQVPSWRQPAITHLLPILKSRYAEYEARAKKAKTELESMINKASSE